MNILDLVFSTSKNSVNIVKIIILTTFISGNVFPTETEMDKLYTLLYHEIDSTESVETKFNKVIDFFNNINENVIKDSLLQSDHNIYHNLFDPLDNIFNSNEKEKDILLKDKDLKLTQRMQQLLKKFEDLHDQNKYDKKIKKALKLTQDFVYRVLGGGNLKSTTLEILKMIKIANEIERDCKNIKEILDQMDLVYDNFKQNINKMVVDNGFGNVLNDIDNPANINSLKCPNCKYDIQVNIEKVQNDASDDKWKITTMGRMSFDA